MTRASRMLGSKNQKFPLRWVCGVLAKKWKGNFLGFVPPLHTMLFCELVSWLTIKLKHNRML